jgi:hypothetical protein
MKTSLEETRERGFRVGKDIREDVFFPEKESDSGECDYYYKCGSDVLRGCSTKTTDEPKILEKDSRSQEERNLREKKSNFNEKTNFGESLCGCDSGKCFDCGV